MKYILILATALFCSIGFSGHLETARNHRNNKKIVEAALAASSGCMEANGVKSCEFLCALVMESSNDSWIEAGCSMACTKGLASSCSSLGSHKISRGKSSEGVQYLRTGCSLGDKLACESLKILNK